MPCNLRITTTVGQLKEHVFDKSAWPVDRIILSCNGADLSDPDRTLNSLNLGFGTKDPIFLRARLRGPMGGMMDGDDSPVSCSIVFFCHTHTHTHTHRHSDARKNKHTHKHTHTHTHTHTYTHTHTHTHTHTQHSTQIKVYDAFLRTTKESCRRILCHQCDLLLERTAGNLNLNITVGGGKVIL